MEDAQTMILEKWKEELESELGSLQSEINNIEYEKLELSTKKRFIKRASDEYENNADKQKFLDAFNYKEIIEGISQRGNAISVLKNKYEEKSGFYKKILNRLEKVTG